MRTLILLLIAGLAPTALAQSSTSSSPQSILTATPTSGRSAPGNSQQDDPVAIAIERAVNRATIAEEKVALYEEKLKAKDDRISAKDAEIELLKQQKADLLNANKDRRDAGNIDAERLADAKAIIAKQDAEIARLRNPGFLSSLFDKRTIYGAVGGYGVCKLTSSGSSTNFLGSQSQFSLFQTSSDERARQALKAIKLQK